MYRLKSLVSRWLNDAFPGSCLLCGSDSPDALLCPACTADLPAPPSACCPQCAEQTTYGERCGACLKDPPHFDQTLAAFHYDFPVNRIIQALKYGHQLAVAKWLGYQLAALIKPGEQLIVPLPLHPERLRERGFNQSMEIARGVGKQLNLPVDHCSLFRNRPTPRQADLPLKERRKNVRGAFECTADMTGKNILLIDDVMTSGATLNECARVLKLHGAAHVTAVVAARALKH
ncbi:ComF family protein [Dechloromonas denitrificans]|uniref:ComF family protein n=1 Tax=Dechloromonas denitrificans TaxID=281362 RepID=UPI001CFA4FA4|nr:ComF family protein [Dechloromonas denitrificans]UCV07290.1 ComF family protein [Dechloromonas denitrificans]